jgi:hypothetical protein
VHTPLHPGTTRNSAQCAQVYHAGDAADARLYAEGAKYFRVRADDGNLYILRHNESGIEDTWRLESFRRA